MSNTPELLPTTAVEVASALLRQQWPKVDFKVRIEGRPAYQMLHVNWINGPTAAQVRGLLMHSGLVSKEGSRHQEVPYLKQYLFTSIQKLELTRQADASLDVTAAGLQVSDTALLSANAANHLLKVAGVRVDKPFAKKLREWANGYQKTIDDKMRDRPRHTHRMARQADSAVADGMRLMKYQAAMRHLADLYDAGTVSRNLTPVRQKWLIEKLIDSPQFASPEGWAWDEYIKVVDNGILSEQAWVVAHNLLVALSQSEQQQEAQQERDLAAQLAANAQAGIEGFFPTPKSLIDRILDGISRDWLGDGDMLEPSAGDGDIAIQLVDRFPSNDLVVIEQNYKLYETLNHRVIGFDGVVGYRLDFTEWATTTNKRFKLIVANPPFENGMDAEHLQLMYDLLEPGGRVYCIISTGPFSRDDRKSRDFREWFESVGGVNVLEEGEYFSRQNHARRVTSVHSKVVMIEKPGQAKPQPAEPEDLPFFALLSTTEADVLYDDLIASGISKRGQMSAAPRDLVAGLGKPTYTGKDASDKSTMEWWFVAEGGLAFTLYDMDMVARGNLKSEASVTFSIGASEDVPAEDLIAFVDHLNNRMKPEPKKDEGDMFKPGADSKAVEVRPFGAFTGVWRKLERAFGESSTDVAETFRGWGFDGPNHHSFLVGAPPKDIPAKPERFPYQVLASPESSEAERDEFFQWLFEHYLQANSQPDSFSVISNWEGVEDTYYNHTERATLQIVPHTISTAIGTPFWTPIEDLIEWWFEDRVTGLQYGIWSTYTDLDHTEPVTFSVGGGWNNNDTDELGLFIAWVIRAFEAEGMDEPESSQPDTPRSKNIADSARNWLIDERELHVYRVEKGWEIYGAYAEEILTKKRVFMSYTTGTEKVKHDNGTVISVTYLRLTDPQLERVKSYLESWFDRVVYHKDEAQPEGPKCASCGKPFVKGEQKMRSHIDGSIICQACYQALPQQPAPDLPAGLQEWLVVKNNDSTRLVLVQAEDGYRTFNVDADTLHRLMPGRFDLRDGGRMGSGYPVRYIEFADTWLLAYTRYLQVQKVAYSVIAEGGEADSFVPEMTKSTLNAAQKLVRDAVRRLPPNTAATVFNIGETVDAEPEVIAQLLDELVELKQLKKNDHHQYERV